MTCDPSGAMSCSMSRFTLRAVKLPNWVGAEVDCEVSLKLLREDLCVTRDFFSDNDAVSFEDMVKRFRKAVPFEFPLYYRVRSIVIAASYEWTVTWALGRRVGPGVFCRMKDLEGS